jgi:long-chain acyl-CoA synthetase
MAPGTVAPVNVPEIFAAMPGRYKKGASASPRSFYFSIGDLRYTVKVDASTCVVEEGKTVENADVVLKTTPDLFQKMVVQGKLPGAIDIAMGRIKTNDPMGLQKLREWFDFSGL